MLSKVTVHIDTINFQKTIDYISTHNPSFIGKKDEIKDVMLRIINEYSLKFTSNSVATMGFIAEFSPMKIEGLYFDTNSIRVHFYVSPSINTYKSAEFLIGKNEPLKDI